MILSEELPRRRQHGRVISALLMFRRLVAVLRHAEREEDFVRILGAAVFLVFLGTLTYWLGADCIPSTASTSPSRR